MPGSTLKEFWDFLKEGCSAQEWLAKAMLATFLLDWIASFGPPQPGKSFVSFLTALFELITAIVVYEYLRRRRAATYRWLLAGGIVLLVGILVGYVVLYLDRVMVIDLSSTTVGGSEPKQARIVKGTEYEQHAVQFREGYRVINHAYPSDQEMVDIFITELGPDVVSARTLQSLIERLWTKRSIFWSMCLLLVLWVALFSSLTYCVLVFLLQFRPMRVSLRDTSGNPPDRDHT
jgi:hypothetical protein